MISEIEYEKNISIDHRKKYAQFFTPKKISDFMASWIVGSKRNKLDILEPAFGLGIFSRSIHKLNPNIKVIGYEIDKTIYKYAKQNLSESNLNISINNENYITSSWNEKFDGIICNPPYIKFHDYDNTTLIPYVNKKLNISLNGFANIYTLFLLKSIFQMNKGARMAYLVPSEFLNSDYGVEVKRILLESGMLKHIIIMDFNKCAFDDALTTACILLFENNEKSDSICFSKINDLRELNLSLTKYKMFNVCELKPEVKWKQYYEDTNSSKYNHLVPFSVFAKVSRGIATGANSYFTFKPSKIDYLNIPENVFLPCICHATDAPNLIFTEKDFENLVIHDKTVFLFNGNKNINDPNTHTYISYGESIGINKKYLTSRRSPWYILENRPPAPIWVSVFNRDGLRFVRNIAGIYNLTTFHSIYNKGVIDTEVLFAYLITNIAKDIFLDNCRQYGNGLVKFEPNDLNNGSIVDLRKLNSEEKNLILKALDVIYNFDSFTNKVVTILDDFFKAKYTKDNTDIKIFLKRIDCLNEEKPNKNKLKKNVPRVKQLNLIHLFQIYEFEPITQNTMDSSVNEHENNYIKFQPKFLINLKKNVLIGNVKNDNTEQFLEGTAKIYYTGKRFPTTIKLNKLYYFMPYLSGKGIRDLYLIKTVRLGCRKEGQIKEDKKDLRLVFEIEYAAQLFEEYMKFNLDIWHTFTNTTLEQIINPK